MLMILLKRLVEVNINIFSITYTYNEILTLGMFLRTGHECSLYSSEANLLF